MRSKVVLTKNGSSSVLGDKNEGSTKAQQINSTMKWRRIQAINWEFLTYWRQRLTRSWYTFGMRTFFSENPETSPFWIKGFCLWNEGWLSPDIRLNYGFDYCQQFRNSLPWSVSFSAGWSFLLQADLRYITIIQMCPLRLPGTVWILRITYFVSQTKARLLIYGT